MLNAFASLKYSKKCQHNVQKPNSYPLLRDYFGFCAYGMHTSCARLVLTVLMSSNLRLISRDKSLYVHFFLRRDCGHQPLTIKSFLRGPSSNSILHLSTATKSSRSLRRQDSLFCLIFSFIFIFLPQNLLLPRGFHTNSVTLSEKSDFSNYIVMSYPGDK